MGLPGLVLVLVSPGFGELGLFGLVLALSRLSGAGSGDINDDGSAMMLDGGVAEIDVLRVCVLCVPCVLRVLRVSSCVCSSCSPALLAANDQRVESAWFVRCSRRALPELRRDDCVSEG
eukprot:m.108039 g.108039  ORF g.108039 m.108039 type:complete len:119 (-) comp15878_c0_seq2:17-373(-)